ncbi:tetratricopeptide repeat protein [Paraburkholderia phosphatilytica]|uniref:tetratricopeptide repeat protein n=1 Tax=Paraburkholderia phosphatilytica TaxID=2282883 RepID=UPI000E4D1B1A|nr:tetratricopeptide repeat protein [Paraburkholderia phosphatilytica]
MNLPPRSERSSDAFETNDPAQAEARYRRLLAHDDRDGVAHNNLANVLRASGRFSEAEAHYRRALEVVPATAAIRNNLAGALEALHRFDEAEAEYRRAIDLDAAFAVARFNLSLLLLSAGRYAEGWPYFDARSQVFQEHGELPFPAWRGEDLSGKSILLLPEQGYGDTIQFVRYATVLKARGAARVSMVSDPLLAPLLRTVEGIDTVIDDPRALHAHDYWVSVMSVPALVGTTLATIPAKIPYVGVYRERLAAWQPRVPTQGLRVGLVWKGNPDHANDAARSVRHFADLQPLWSVGGVSFVSLQTGDVEAEAEACSATQPLTLLGRDLKDFADTAAVVAQLNLVICVDTAIAHLAGALGVACWVMLPGTGVDWRWHRAGTGSHWYPKDMYLFRQGEGGWPGVIESVRDTLADVMRGR